MFGMRLTFFSPMRLTIISRNLARAAGCAAMAKSGFLAELERQALLSDDGGTLASLPFMLRLS